MKFHSAKLKDIVSLADSGTWGENGSPSNGFPVLRSSNIQNFQLNLTDVAWRKLPQKDIDRKRLQDGDIIVTTSSGSPGLIGKCCLFQQPSDGHPYYFSNFTLRLRFQNNLAVSKWVFYWLTSPIGRVVMESMNDTTSGLRNLNRNIYLEQKIPLPSLEEQKRIVAILNKADSIRRKGQQAIKLSDDFLRTTFLDMFGDPVTNPKGWEVKPAGTLLSFLTSGSRGWARYYSNKGVLFLRIQNVGRNELILEDVAFVSPPESAEARRTKVREGDVLLSITADLGRTAVVPKELPDAHINQHLAILRFQGVEPVYISAFLATSGGQEQIKKLNREGVKAGLNFDNVRSLKIMLPPEILQKKWVYIYKKTMKQNCSLQSLSKLEADLFNSLTQRAFRGEL